MKKNILIVGAGLAGSTIARFLANKGVKVSIIERRSHVAGNIFDEKDENGILVQRYGPHIFHTSSRKVWSWVEQFAQWNDFKHEPMVCFNRTTTVQPFNFQSIDDFLNDSDAEKTKTAFMNVYPYRESVTIPELLSSDNDLIRQWGEFLWENDYKPYTAKQWGRKPEDIDPNVLKRVPFRLSYDKGYFPSKERVAMPEGGFTQFVCSLLDHPLITVETGVDVFTVEKVNNKYVKKLHGEIINIPVVFTGAIDDLFNHELGVLPYRSLSFEWVWEDKNSVLNAPVMAYPQLDSITRVTEFRKMPIQNNVNGSICAIERPSEYIPGENDPYYPVRTIESEKLYEKYLNKFNTIDGLFAAGRLADYKYYDMGPVIATSLKKADKIYEYMKSVNVVKNRRNG